MDETQQQPVPEPPAIAVKISLPSSKEPLEISVSGSDTLADLKQTLTVLSASRHLTSYDLYHGKANLSGGDELVTFEEVAGGSGSVNLTLKYRAYNLAAVHEHILRFREAIGLHFSDANAQAFGVATGATKINALSLEEVKATAVSESESETGDEKDSEKAADGAEKAADGAEKAPEAPKLSEEETAAVSAAAEGLIAAEEPTIAGHAPTNPVQLALRAPIRLLAVSAWLPALPEQQLQGDLLYLTLQTLEGETFQITCHQTGFFVNRALTAHFDGRQKAGTPRNFVLHALVASLSALFVLGVDKNEQLLAQSTAYPETYLVPSTAFLAHPWAAHSGENAPDSLRLQLPLLGHGVDGADIVRDWNDDFQAIRELPKGSVNERILRERLVNKALHEFNRTATETAISIVKGNIVALNPGEEAARRIYLRNGIFYSYGVNATGAFDDSGADEAARYAAAKDLAGVRVLNRVDVDGIHSLVTCIVDYMGERIVCQAPVPGIFNSDVSDEAEEVSGEDGAAGEVESEPSVTDGKVAYGLSADRTHVVVDESFATALQPVADAFHLKAHDVTVEGQTQQVVVSKDTKGIAGTDGRKYVIDLYRTTPLDVEFIENYCDSSETSYPHKEAVLRHEAVEEWYKRKAAALFKAETDRLEKEGRPATSQEGDKVQLAIPFDLIVLNPDAFAGVGETSEDAETVRGVSQFIKEKLVEEFLDEAAGQVAPFDGAHLSDMLHKQGINLRYLGHVAERALAKKAEEEKRHSETVAENLKLVAEKEEQEKKAREAEAAKAEKSETPAEKGETLAEKSETPAEKAEKSSAIKLVAVVAQLASIHRTAVQEMVARASKHVLRALGASVPVLLKAHLVAHFHNCLLGKDANSVPTVAVEEHLRGFLTDDDLSFASLSPEDVEKLVAREVHIRFRYALPENWRSLVPQRALLREIALKVGVQWKAQNYGFSKAELEVSPAPVEAAKGKKSKKNAREVSEEAVSARGTTFLPSDILCFVPVVKDAGYRATLVDEIHETARVQLSKGETAVGVALLTELGSIYEQIYGRVHPETAKYYAVLAQAYADAGHGAEACATARRAVVLAERTAGVDSHSAVTACVNAAFFEGLHGGYANALKLYERVFADWNVVYGENHPSSVNTLLNLAELLSEHGLFVQARKFYERAQAVSDSVNGPVSAFSAMISYRFGGTLLQAGDFAGGLVQFEKAGAVFRQLVGPEDRFSTECAGFVANISTYLAYNEAQAAEKKKQLAQQAAAAGGRVRVKAAGEQQAKGRKKKASPQPNPEISSKSVEDILKFIEGEKPKKSKKKGRR